MRKRTSAALVVSIMATALGCGPSDRGGAANIGVEATLEPTPEVMIDSVVGTDVRVFVHLRQFDGPETETFAVIEAALGRDLETFAPVTLAIPQDHPPFAGLGAGEELELQLTGSTAHTHDDWALCGDPGAVEADEQRVSLDLVLEVTPGANDGADTFVFESVAVALACSFTG